MKYRYSVIGIFLGIYSVSSMGATVPIRQTDGISSITFWEATNGLTSYTFNVDSHQLMNRLNDPLSDTYNDFRGARTEYYDVFYSNADGSFNIDGAFVTIEAVFSFDLPNGGGLNLSEVFFNFDGQPSQHANIVTDYIFLGNNSDESTVLNAIDGDIYTYTTMGNTLGQSQRLSITVSAVPIPSPFVLFATTLGVMGLLGRRPNRATEA